MLGIIKEWWKLFDFKLSKSIGNDDVCRKCHFWSTAPVCLFLFCLLEIPTPSPAMDGKRIPVDGSPACEVDIKCAALLSTLSAVKIEWQTRRRRKFHCTACVKVKSENLFFFFLTSRNFFFYLADLRDVITRKCAHEKGGNESVVTYRHILALYSWNDNNSLGRILKRTI